MVRGGASRRNSSRGRMTGSESRGGHEEGSSNSSPILSVRLHTEAAISPDQHGEHVDGDNVSSILSRTRGMNQGTNIPIDPVNRQPLEIMNGSFVDPSVTRAIVVTMKQYFSQPWEKWMMVPMETRDLLWNKFQEKYTWPEDHASEVKHVWEQTSKRRFSSIFNQARKDALKKAGDKENILEAKGHGPIWIAPDVWDKLVDIWNSPKWKDKSEAARKNRMTEKDGGITKHTSGSITFATHKKRMAIELGRPPTQLETFERTHKQKGSSGEFVDNKSKRVSEEYFAALTAKYGSDISSQPEFDSDAWVQAAGRPNKGRLYGFGPREDPKRLLGSSSSSYSATSGYPFSSSQHYTEDQIQHLREEIRQEIRQELQHEIRQEMQQEMVQMKEEMMSAVRAMMSKVNQPHASQPDQDRPNA